MCSRRARASTAVNSWAFPCPSTTIEVCVSKAGLTTDRHGKTSTNSSRGSVETRATIGATRSDRNFSDRPGFVTAISLERHLRFTTLFVIHRGYGISHRGVFSFVIKMFISCVRHNSRQLRCTHTPMISFVSVACASAKRKMAGRDPKHTHLGELYGTPRREPS